MSQEIGIWQSSDGTLTPRYGGRNSYSTTIVVNTPVYAGPLNLLLKLIERAELDVTKLSLAQVTNQYLLHLKEIQAGILDSQQLVEEVSAFIVIAAKLLQIKSEVLLPRPTIKEEGEEDLGEVLARQVILYRGYRKAAQFLAEREYNGFITYLRLVAPTSGISGLRKVDLNGVGIKELVEAAVEAFNISEPSLVLNRVVDVPKVTIKERLGYIVETLRNRGRITFRLILSGVGLRVDAVVSFLALLELIKCRVVAVRQDSIFEDIEITPADAWRDPMDLEF